MTREFYDIISPHYSRDRYLSGVTNAVQYSYAKRLNIVRAFVGRALDGVRDAHILDIGTADGYVLRHVYDDNSSAIEVMVGNDIAPKMLVEARNQSEGYPVVFVLRGQEPSGQYDLVLEIGVHTHDLDAELEWIVSHLKPGGCVVLTVANRDSLFTRMKLTSKPYIGDYHSFNQYEHILMGRFDLVCQRTFGIFIPKLWVLPLFFARPIQNAAEWISERLIPNAMHERVYLLRLRPRS